MPDVADGGDPPEHLRECASCAALAQRHRALAAGLQQLAADRNAVQAPPALEAQLVAAFRAQRGRQSLAPRVWLAWAAAAAALLVITVSLLLVRGRAPQLTGAPDPGSLASASIPADPDAADSDFIPLPYESAEGPVSSVTENADLVRVEVPRSALIALGIPVPAEASAGRVEAVVALGADGMLEGVRILQ